jgi:hypothetical protein
MNLLISRLRKAYIKIEKYYDNFLKDVLTMQIEFNLFMQSLNNVILHKTNKYPHCNDNVNEVLIFVPHCSVRTLCMKQRLK